MIGRRWEKREISGNICDKTQRLVKMGLGNTVNLCSHTFRHFSWPAKLCGAATQGLTSDVCPAVVLKYSLFLSADGGGTSRDALITAA